jgi:hypothetical protein
MLQKKGEGRLRRTAIACFDEDAAADDGCGNDGASGEIKHTDGSGGALEQGWARVGNVAV